MLRQLDSANGDCRVVESFESQHRPDPLLDSAVVLFDEIVQVLARPHFCSTWKFAGLLHLQHCAMRRRVGIFRTIGRSARPPRLQRSSLPERRTARSRSQTQRPDRVGLGYVRVRHGVRGRLVLLLHTFLVIFPKYKTAGLIQSRGKGLLAFLLVAIRFLAVHAAGRAVNQFSGKS